MTIHDLSVVGQPVRRVDGLDKALGRARYALDLLSPGTLCVKTLRSPLPHARVLRIDIRQVETVPGVAAVITARDVRGTNRHGIQFQDQPVLVAEGHTVRLVGDPIALVVAETEEAAAEAVDRIVVEYEELPVVGSPEEGLQPGAWRVHEEWPSNVLSDYHFARGKVAEGFAQADVVVEHTYRLPRQEHAFLETEGGIATVGDGGAISVYAAAQRPVWVRGAIARALGLPESKVRVVSTLAGGGFGGKADVTMHAHLALAAMVTGRPVRLVWTREESFLMHPKRHPMSVRCKLGATRAGKVTAIEAEILADAGAYASHSGIVLYAAGSYLPGPYDIPHIKVDGWAVYTNNPITGACRGYGQPQAVTVLECEMDVLARELGLDPAAFRLQNALHQGVTPGCTRIVLDSEVSLPETVARVFDAAGPVPRPSRPRRKIGRGISCAMPIFDISAFPTADMKGVGASVELYTDGTALVRSGVCEIGSGITTVLCQIAAEELGIPLHDIALVNGDTASTPDAGPIVASRQAYCSGNAMKLAAVQLRQRLLARAAEELQVPSEDLTLRDGRVMVGEETSLLIGEVAALCRQEGISLVGQGWFASDHAPAGHTFMTVLADVEVDEETGQVQVLRLITAHDCGKALNPLNVKGQLIGGALQGMGYALMEDLAAVGGRLLAPSLTEYLIPTALDAPDEAAALLVEQSYPTGPFGAKGVGEHATDAAPAAVLNAIHDAVGVRLTELPATPERVRRAVVASCQEK